jgi:hypothetical protein
MLVNHASWSTILTNARAESEPSVWVKTLPMTPSTAERSLTKLAHIIKEDPDSPAGVQIRKFLWSLYDMHHLVSNWTINGRVEEDEHRKLVSEVFAAYLERRIAPADIKRALLVCGDHQRFAATCASEETIIQLEDVEKDLAGLIRVVPPSEAHTELVKLLHHFAVVKATLLAGNLGDRF